MFEYAELSFDENEEVWLCIVVCKGTAIENCY
jgi:hypothetical protein